MKIIEDKTFKDLTTFRIGGKIKYYIEVADIKEIAEAVLFAKKNNLQIFIIGGGSDLLAGDSEFDGLVVKYIGNSISYLGEGKIKAEADAGWDDFVEFAINKGLQGMECMAGIPGTVGASPIQNIGAYGQELKDVFESLNAYDIEKEQMVSFGKSDCQFGYRESIFKQKSHWQKYLITEVTLKLVEGGKPAVNYDSLKGLIGENPTLREVANAIVKIRRSKLEDPKLIGNAGSFFKNPIISAEQKNKLEQEFPDVKIFPFGDKYKVPAAWLIEKTGWKGKSYKEAGVSKKHALILINVNGKAKAEDIYKFSEMILNDIDRKFGIKLEREVQIINF
jgi:UDP-N-acetylmuramate dehydrogenase